MIPLVDKTDPDFLRCLRTPTATLFSPALETGTNNRRRRQIIVATAAAATVQVPLQVTVELVAMANSKN